VDYAAERAIQILVIDLVRRAGVSAQRIRIVIEVESDDAAARTISKVGTGSWKYGTEIIETEIVIKVFPGAS